jgi:anaerobic selenocysteine-containing dehydrogenase
VGSVTARTVCNRDCPDACGLIATVEDGRLIRLSGDPDHPVTRGFLCSRTTQFPARQNDPSRVLSPLLRKNGILTPVSWDEAIAFAAERLLAIRRESGPAAVLHYRSGGSLGLLKTVVDRFWEAFGPVSVKRGDICSGAGDAAQMTDFGEEDSHDLFDLLNAKSILLWGKNAHVSSVHLLPILKEARRKGARVVLIDPVHHRTANVADTVILPRPGGDFALAMAAAGRLFERGQTDPEAASYCDHLGAFRSLVSSRTVAEWTEEAGVTSAEADAVASALAGRPCCIVVGWGLGRRMNGSATIRALDALGAVSGNLGIPGGGVSFYFKRRGAFDMSFLSGASARKLSEPLLGQEILAAKEPEIRAVWVTAANPVAMLPDSSTVARAFESRELVVVVDSFLTDTARRAHLVLPTTTLVEDDDLLGSYGHHWIGASTPVLPRPEGVRSDLEIVQLLAGAIDARTGANGNGLGPAVAGSAADWKRRFLSKVAPFGASLEVLEQRLVRNPIAPTILFADRKFPTLSGKVNLVHASPPSTPEEPGFPFWLFSNSTERSQCSQWAGAPPDLLTVTCHPEAARGLAEGDLVVLESAIGRLKARLAFDPHQRRDVLLVPKGGHFDAGTCANALIRARTTDDGDGAAYMDCRVRMIPAPA